jgi:FMN phosphatase YigB (HAD superfamily)
MPLTVLFDLDDTLLSTHMDQFLPGYFALLGETLSHLGSHEQITGQIQFAVQQMVKNQDPEKTLKEIFDENFYPALSTTEQACQHTLESFYQNIYPDLKPITQARPAAADLVKWCQSEGMVMAIATNPLFPHSATLQRIQWAGLDPAEFSYFTSYDDFHFTKPHLSYYAEVLGRLGWPEGPIVMIGDNLTYDLFPVDTFGYATYWVTDDKQGISWEGGSLSNVKPWLKSVMNRDGHHLAYNPLVQIAILLSTPAVLDTFIREILSNPKANNGHESQTRVMDTIFKLINQEETVYLPLWEQISSDPRATFPMPGRLPLPIKSTGNDQHAQGMFTQFLQARKTSLSLIEHLYEQGWLDPSGAIDQNHQEKIKSLLGTMAEQDQLSLHQLNNL